MNLNKVLKNKYLKKAWAQCFNSFMLTSAWPHCILSRLMSAALRDRSALRCLPAPCFVKQQSVPLWCSGIHPAVVCQPKLSRLPLLWSCFPSSSSETWNVSSSTTHGDWAPKCRSTSPRVAVFTVSSKRVAPRQGPMKSYSHSPVGTELELCSTPQSGLLA